MDPTVEKGIIAVLVIVAVVLGFNLLINTQPFLTGFIIATPTPSSDVNVTIISAASITITSGEDLNLGTLFVGDSNTSQSGTGIVVENNGSIDVDLNVYSTTAFFTGTSKPADHNFLGCKIANSEGGSITTVIASTYRDCYNTGTPGTALGKGFNFETANDTVRVDLNVFVPLDQPAGLVQAVLTLKAAAAN